MNSGEAKLLKLFRVLPEEQQQALLSYAAWLSQQHSVSTRSTDAGPVPEPRQIPRPGHETVINAVKRMADTYYMLDTDKIFHQTSSLVTQHLMEGRAAGEVIDELEALFRSHYEEMLKGAADDPA